MKWQWVLPAVGLGCTLGLQDFYLTPITLQDSQAQFFDEPSFAVAGVTDNTYRGGHGADTVLRSAESLADAEASLGEVQDDAQNPVAAAQAFQRAAELNPSESNLFDWGTELLRHRASNAAAEVFSNGVRHYPESMRMELGLAAALYVGGSYQRAAECFFAAADKHPEDPNPYLFLSKVQAREITESDGYQERMARFAKLQPANPLANYFYAVSLWKRDSGDSRVRGLLEKAIAMDPKFSPAYLQLGILDAAERNYSAAIRQYQKAIEFSADLPEAHYRLSEAYRVMGDRPKAAEELAIYNRLSKESAEKKERERRQLRQFVVDLRSR